MAMNEKLVMPMPFTIAQGHATAVNLGNERLGRTGDPAGVIVDLGAQRTFDTVALLATDAIADRVWLPRYFTTYEDARDLVNPVGPVANAPAWASAEASKRYHRQGLRMIGQLVTARFVRIDTSHPFSVGRLVIGLSYTALDTMDVGYSFKVVDLGERRTSSNALSNTVLRGKVLEYSWTWSWMTEQEARGALLDLHARAGTTRDILCILNPDAPDLHNVIGYGPLVEEVPLQNVAGGNGIDNAYEARYRLQSRLILNL